MVWGLRVQGLHLVGFEGGGERSFTTQGSISKPFENTLHKSEWGVSTSVVSTRWSSLARISERYVTKFAPHKALTLIARGKLTFDDRVELHRVVKGSGWNINFLLGPLKGFNPRPG